MMGRQSRRQFLLSVGATLFGSWVSRFWRKQERFPPEAYEWHSYGMFWEKDKEPKIYTSTLAEAFNEQEGSLMAWSETPKCYIDGILQKEPIAWWPISLPGVERPNL